MTRLVLVRFPQLAALTLACACGGDGGTTVIGPPVESIWTAMTSGTTEGLRGAWGLSATDVIAVGDGGTILNYDGSSWTSATSGVGVTLHHVWGTAPDDIFSVGNSGTILHFDGSAWSAMTSNTAEDLRGVWGSATGQAGISCSPGRVRGVYYREFGGRPKTMCTQSVRTALPCTTTAPLGAE